jgi:hypothetical protein
MDRERLKVTQAAYETIRSAMHPSGGIGSRTSEIALAGRAEKNRVVDETAEKIKEDISTLLSLSDNGDIDLEEYGRYHFEVEGTYDDNELTEIDYAQVYREVPVFPLERQLPLDMQDQYEGMLGRYSLHGTGISFDSSLYSESVKHVLDTDETVSVLREAAVEKYGMPE